MIWHCGRSKCGWWFDTTAEGCRATHLIGIDIIETPRDLSMRIVRLYFGPFFVGVGYSRPMTPKLEAKQKLRQEYTEARLRGEWPLCDNCLTPGPNAKKSKCDEL